MRRAGKRKRAPARPPGQMELELFGESRPAAKPPQPPRRQTIMAASKATKSLAPTAITAPSMPTPPASLLLDVRQAAARLGLSKSTLDKMRSRGVGPKFIKSTDRAVRYDPRDLDAWVDERRRQSTDSA